MKNLVRKHLMPMTSLVMITLMGLVAFWQAQPAFACDASPPIASFTYVVNDLTVDFTDTTDDGCGDNSVAWVWDFDDGNTSTVGTPSHTYATGGTYNVCMTSTDGWGISDTACQNVTVTDPAPADGDSDGVPDTTDNCPTVPNPGQEDSDGDGTGDACDAVDNTDTDSDGVEDRDDNCVNIPNPGQEDSDGDGTGDACDTTNDNDPDGDGFDNNSDTCPNRGDEGFGVQENGCPPHIVLPPDNRINWQFGDLGAVVYDHSDGAVVYCYTDGDSWLGMHISQAVVDNADNGGDQSVPVMTIDELGCRAAFYMLDNGQYQINIWSEEGKMYEIIADSLDFANAEMRYLDPSE